MDPRPAAVNAPADDPGRPSLLARCARSFRKRGLAGSLRVLAAFAVVLALLWISSPTPLTVALGLPCMLLGEAWRAWAAGHLLKSRELAVSGPYRHVQNPLYFGRLCLLTGVSLMAWIPWSWRGTPLPLNGCAWLLIVGVFFLYYLPRKRRVEGERLRRLHGEAWVRWSSHVPEIFPRLTPWGANVRPWTRERFDDNDEGLMVLLVVALVAAFAWKALSGG